jgi:hypothetical protein
MNQVKMAVSLAVVAAIAVSAIASAWRLKPGKRVEFSSDQRQAIASYVDQTNGCTTFMNEGTCTRSIREALRNQMASGGHWEPAERVTLRYVSLK